MTSLRRIAANSSTQWAQLARWSGGPVEFIPTQGFSRRVNFVLGLYGEFRKSQCGVGSHLLILDFKVFLTKTTNVIPLFGNVG